MNRSREAVILTAEFLSRRRAERALAVLHEQGHVDLKRCALLTRAERGELQMGGERGPSIARRAFIGSVLGTLRRQGAEVLGLPGVGPVLGLGRLGSALLTVLTGNPFGSPPASPGGVGFDRMQLDILKGALQRDRSVLVIEASPESEAAVRNHIRQSQGRLL